MYTQVPSSTCASPASLFCPSDADVFLIQAHLISSSAACSLYDLLSGLPNVPEPLQYSSYLMYMSLPFLFIRWCDKYFFSC